MEERYDFRSIEAKWQQRWEQEKTFRAPDHSEKPKLYALEFFPYPSGAGLHVGHLKNYVPTDAYCRFKSMRGYNVLHPMGWDAFGQPAENEAIRLARNPREMVPEYAASYKRTLKQIGASYDWDREINSSLPDYYRWTQWIFLLLYHRGLAYRAVAPINWCPECKTGLANEEVKEGRCWRCKTPIEKRPMPQWYLKVTGYADRLLADLDTIDWPEGIKQMQREWIGRSEGAEVDFPIPDFGFGITDCPSPKSKIPNPKSNMEKVRVFTTRADTVFGATFIVLAPEHPLARAVTTPDRHAEVDAYVRRAQQATEIERGSSERAKTGVFTGGYALNPANQERIPIWIADYVLMSYGTGAIMAVPAHDQRDFEFARRYGLPIRLVYHTPDGPTEPDAMAQALPHGGTLVNSGPFTGLPDDSKTIRRLVDWLEETGCGTGRVQYRLRDWLISRQRYWGAPIPIIHCPACGEVPVPEAQLPVLLPEVDHYQPSGTGASPLALIPEFVHTTCPGCSGPARRETDTMGGAACSSWYFLRFADPHNDREFAAREQLDHWLPVDLYVGGAEHAVMHLLYARFWTKVLHDAGCISFQEPFLKLRNQGQLLAWTPGRRLTDSEEQTGDTEPIVDWIVLRPEERASFPPDQIVWRWARMSKSRQNVITPDEIAEKYGADSLRVYELFVVPFEENVQWTEEGLAGASRFLHRVWRWATTALLVDDPDWPDQLPVLDLEPAGRRLRRKLHQTIRKVSDDLEGFHFNTAIAALMELVNELSAHQPAGSKATSTAAPAVVSEALEALVLLLAPFAPHLADELWERMGKTGSTYHAAWPAFDPTVAADPEITIVIQVNGKLRDRLTLPADTPVETLKQHALASPKVQGLPAGKQVRNLVVVPGKLVNIVAAMEPNA